MRFDGSFSPDCFLLDGQRPAWTDFERIRDLREFLASFESQNHRSLDNAGGPRSIRSLVEKDLKRLEERMRLI